MQTPHKKTAVWYESMTSALSSRRANQSATMPPGVKSFYLFLICIYNKGRTQAKMTDNLMKIKTNKNTLKAICPPSPDNIFFPSKENLQYKETYD